MENRETPSFQYSYSSKQQEEVRHIRQKYQPRPEDKMAQLRRLDASATQKGTKIALVVGILSSLILGTGMSLCMVFDSQWFLPGIFIGLVGIAGVAAAYPLYAHITKKERARLAPEILRLTDELLK